MRTHGSKRPMNGLFAQLQDVSDAQGRHLNTVLFSDRGDCSVIIEVENPVLQYCTDAEQYAAYADVLNNIVQTLGEGYALQKQDIFCRQRYHHELTPDAAFLSQAYFKYFEGRQYTEIKTYLIITQEAVRSTFVKYDPKLWLDFHVKVGKVTDILAERGISHRKLDRSEVDEYLHRFMAFQFRKGPFAMRNFKSGDEYLNMGDRVLKSVNLVDVDVINLPSYLKPYQTTQVNGYRIATDVLSFLSSVPDADCIVYNQVMQIPQQRRLLRKLQGNADGPLCFLGRVFRPIFRNASHFQHRKKLIPAPWMQKNRFTPADNRWKKHFPFFAGQQEIMAENLPAHVHQCLRVFRKSVLPP